MGLSGLIFLLIAVFGGVINFTSGLISKITRISELAIKIFALIIVVASLTLLFILGK